MAVEPRYERARFTAAVRRRIARPARADIADILDRSVERFGPTARRRYERLIGAALVEITSEDEPLGSKPATGVGSGIRLYHLRNCRLDAPVPRVGKPRHFVVYRRPEPDLVLVLRVLHEAMNLPDHLDEDDA